MTGGWADHYNSDRQYAYVQSLNTCVMLSMFRFYRKQGVRGFDARVVDLLSNKPLATYGTLNGQVFCKTCDTHAAFVAKVREWFGEPVPAELRDEHAFDPPEGSR